VRLKMDVLKGEEGMGALGFDHSCSPCAAEVYKRLVNFFSSHTSNFHGFGLTSCPQALLEGLLLRAYQIGTRLP
jgi:hypothetical protein